MRWGYNRSNFDIAQDSHKWSEQHNQNDDYHCVVFGTVIINDYVWIASRATVSPGVHVGKEGVLAACAVVTRDVPKMKVFAGGPARIISERKSK